jgi:hypothetical protein
VRLIKRLLIVLLARAPARLDLEHGLFWHVCFLATAAARKQHSQAEQGARRRPIRALPVAGKAAAGIPAVWVAIIAGQGLTDVLLPAIGGLPG